jgi:hypothetical protein
MKHLLAAAAAAGLLLSVCAFAAEAPTPPKKSARPAQGKPQAPATITAKLEPGRASITVRFHSAVTDAAVEVHGVDGLVVTSAAVPLSGGRFAQGESVTLDVVFTEGEGPGQLAVSVTGTFGGARRNATTAFVTRSPTPQQPKPSGAATDSTGRRIKLMPAESH